MRKSYTGYFPVADIILSMNGPSFSCNLYGGVQHQIFLNIVKETMLPGKFVGVPICEFTSDMSISRFWSMSDDVNLDEKLEKYFSKYLEKSEHWLSSINNWEILLRMKLDAKYDDWSYYSIAILFKLTNNENELRKWRNQSSDRVISVEEYREFTLKILSLKM